MSTDLTIRGPNIAGTYNIFLMGNGGARGMSITLEEAVELARQLEALLEGKV